MPRISLLSVNQATRMINDLLGLTIYLKPLYVFVRAFIRITDNNKFIGVVWVFVNVQYRFEYDICGVFGLITV